MANKPRTPNSAGEWKCTGCLTFKPAVAFHANKVGRGGIKSRCIECTRLKDTAWRYGLSPDRYQLMLNERQGLCAICGQPEPESFGFQPKYLAIDHDHNCCPPGKSCGLCVRDLLCSGCNTGYGLAERPDLLRAKADYLEKWAIVLASRYESGKPKVGKPGVRIPGRQGVSSLTREDVKSILASTESQSVLAARYGVSRSAISAVKTRRTWKDLNDGQVDIC